MNLPNRKPFYALITFGISLLSVESVSFIGIKALQWKKPEIHYTPEVVDKETYERYVGLRDTILGWPPRNRFGNDCYDGIGSRIIPSYPDPFRDTALISLYGDSYTESAEADSAQAWSNQLSLMIGGRVANFGVSGFGSDQAFLRFMHNKADQARIVFLNHMTDDGLRNVNQWQYLVSSGLHGGEMGFKPRFIVENKSLKLIPLPTLTYEEYVECNTRPEKYLHYEFFLPDNGVSGIQRASFPYTASLIRTFDNFFLKPRIAQVPRHSYHDQRGHPSGVLAVTHGILRESFRAATRLGRIPIVTIIPDGKDLEYFLNHREWAFQLLIDGLKRDSVEVLNFGPGIIKKLNGRSPCEAINDCCNHPNAEGYRMMAEIAYEYPNEQHLLRETGR